MVTLASLWLPIVLSAVAVFLVSAVIHMVLPWHRADFDDLPDEEAVMVALRGVELPPGNYVIPRAMDMKEMSSPEYVERRAAGPVAFINVLPSGPPAMGKELFQWFVFTLVVSVFAAYVASRAIGPAAHYLDAFRFAGTTAFLAYGVGLWQDSIFWGRKWRATLMFTLDGAIYALLTAGFFGWLWPA